MKRTSQKTGVNNCGKNLDGEREKRRRKPEGRKTRLKDTSVTGREEGGRKMENRRQ